MCAICGCGRPDEGSVEHEHVGADGKTYRHTHGVGEGEHAHGNAHEHEHGNAHGHEHEHEHGNAHGHEHAHAHEHGHAHAHGNAHAHEVRLVRIERDILAKNDGIARENRARFEAEGVFVVNLMSSPGSGKTTLLVRTIQALAGRRAVAVIEGDQHTSLDADRIRATGAPAVQINTGKACHLDASMVARAVRELSSLGGRRGVLFIENVGNLVCPAGFDLGEHRRVIVASVTEGEDKPLKYPDMFAVADAVLVNKIDLLPHLAFDLGALEANVRKLAPSAAIFPVSATTGEGFGAWLDWIERGVAG